VVRCSAVSGWSPWSWRSQCGGNLPRVRDSASRGDLSPVPSPLCGRQRALADDDGRSLTVGVKTEGSFLFEGQQHGDCGGYEEQKRSRMFQKISKEDRMGDMYLARTGTQGFSQAPGY